ncbi:LacI family DNA-binding transcriptional regulator [Granulicella sibirica]|nr:LacI family DNA-binding transcriptional regulator [Granulicella sibirica]
MNIKAVASRANVSTATVSRTINGSAKVSPETAARVHLAIGALNFFPNTNARALGSGRSNLLGLIISEITNPFFPELVKAFEDIAVGSGKEILIANTNYDPERTMKCVTRMLERKVDGVAIMTSEMDDHLIEFFRKKHIPVVFLDTGEPAPGISCVHIDYSAGVEMAMSHLVKLGHKRIAFISGPLSLTSARTRYRAFADSSARDHLQANPDLVQEGNHRPDGGYKAMCRILDSKTMPTAVLTSNDLTAIGALGAIAERGLRVPQDISIIGFDDIQLSAYTTPALTTVRLPHTSIAEAAIHSLLKTQGAAGQKPTAGEQHFISPTFVERKSTGPVPQVKKLRSPKLSRPVPQVS